MGRRRLTSQLAERRKSVWVGIPAPRIPTRRQWATEGSTGTQHTVRGDVDTDARESQLPPSSAGAGIRHSWGHTYFLYLFIFRCRANGGISPETFEKEELLQGLLDVGIRGRGTAGDPNDGRAIKRKEVVLDADLAVNVPVGDRVVGGDALGPVNVVGCNAALFGDLDEMGRIGAVPATHDEDEVHLAGVRRVDHVGDRILPLLGRIADRVKGRVAVLDVVGAETHHHGLLEELADGHGLLLVHGGLVGKADLLEVLVRVEALADGVGKLLQNEVPAFWSGVHNVVAHNLGFVHVLHNDVVLAERRGGNGFLVGVLAVDDAGHVGLGVLVHDVPHLGHPGARCVHRRDASVVQELHLLQGRAKRREDHHVSLRHLIEPLALRSLLNELNFVIRHELVHSRIMNQLISDVNALAVELLAR
mmetsp:Transcript_3701/g.10838  ORF Transcript_3701/g.10838 Transcript_3701/m.10838 type:complete len:419 (+) Transcript_3701:154-1410(+)